MSSRIVDTDDFNGFMALCRQRFVSHSLLRGISSVVLITVGTILCAGLFDFLMPLPGYLRLILLLGMLVLSVLSILRFLLRPLTQGISDAELGAAADLACPELDEALATLVSVESPDASSAEAGSAIMRQNLWQQTRPRLTTASQAPVMESGTTAKRCGAAASIILVTLVPLIAWQSGSLLLLERLLLPLRNHATATNLYFDVMSPGDVVARGDDVVFQARPMWRSGTNHDPPSEATLLLTTGSGLSDALQMKYDKDTGYYTATLREISSSLDWQINAGRTMTEVHSLRVVDRPQLIDAILTVTPPAYTGLPPRQWPGITGTMDILEGSEVTLTLKSRAPIASVELVWLDDPEIQPEASDGSPDEIAIPFTLNEDSVSASLSFPAERGGMFRLKLTDYDNITNHDEQQRLLRLLLDEPPTLSVRGIRSQETMRPDAIVPMNVLANDDIGLASLELHVQRDDREVTVIPAGDLVSGDQEFDSEFRTDLSELDLVDGDNVQLQVRATDGYVPKPHEVWSDIIQIRIDPNAKPVGADAMNESTRQLVEQLEAVRRQLQKDIQTLNELKRQASESWTQSSQANTARLSEQEQQHGRQLEELAHQASRHPLMASPAADLNHLASALREQVAGHLNQADTSDSNTAAQALDQSKESLLTARSELDRIIEQIEQAGKLEQDLAELNRLALEAEQLANDARQHQQQPNPDDSATTAESERIDSVRNKLTDDLANLLDEQARLRDAAQQSVRNRLKDAARQAADLAEQQQHISDGLTRQANDRGDSVEPPSADPHAGTENLLDRIEELAAAAHQLSELTPDEAASDSAEQMRTSASQAAELSRTGQFDQSAELLRKAADAASQHQLQAGDRISQDQKQQSDRLQNQLRQAANLIADLEQNDDAQLAVQSGAQVKIAAATEDLVSDLSNIQDQIRMPALDMRQEQSGVEAAEQSSINARNGSKDAADKLPAGQLRQAADKGAQAAAALRRVAEVAQQPPADKSEDTSIVPPEVGQSVTDALQNLSNAAQATSESLGDSPTDATDDGASGKSGSQESDDNSGESSSSDKAQPNPSANSADGDAADDSDGGGQPSEPSDGSSLDEQRARQLANAAAALSDAARQSLPALDDNDATMDSNGQQAGTGTASDKPAGFAADLAAPPQPAAVQRNWRRLNDELNSDLLSGDQESGDARYGPLIRAYFRQLARQSATTNQRVAP